MSGWNAIAPAYGLYKLPKQLSNTCVEGSEPWTALIPQHYRANLMIDIVKINIYLVILCIAFTFTFEV